MIENFPHTYTYAVDALNVIDVFSKINQFNPSYEIIRIIHCDTYTSVFGPPLPTSDVVFKINKYDTALYVQNFCNKINGEN